MPGHTLDHIAYFSASEGALFCGDTLFVGLRTCFQEQQANACIIREVGALNGDSMFLRARIHLANLRFALRVEPQNQALQLAMKSCQAKRQRGEPTVQQPLQEGAPTILLRWHSAEIQC